jgi:hypothetical protein
MVPVKLKPEVMVGTGWRIKQMTFGGEATSDAKEQKVFILGDKQKRILSRIKSQGFISGTSQRK